MNFPDFPHLHQLQKDLWQWPNSKAAVMIGAGFSLNANPEPGVKMHFPTWKQLTRLMFDELHPMRSDASAEELARHERRFLSIGALRIASEYEATFGRQQLENTIRANTPDSKYRPGDLHKLLLQLPWTDVFTTNYDTLLERTELSERSYYPVIKATELPTAFSPRIIKLHGSLPTQTPFIITEEDFRTYPRHFAPFVNTVQQSLLENTFVLLGFSGDDPNFLAWTGWIRDELGLQHAPIYLVGSFSLDNAERLLLYRRGVTPIDLSAVFHERFGEQNVHSACLKWFLRQLHLSRPRRPSFWPYRKNDLQNKTMESSLIPDLHILDTDYGPEPPKHFPDIPLDDSIVKVVFARWQFERKHYPGWIVLGDEKRQQIWEETKYWLEPLLTRVRDSSALDRVLLFREINWRLEISMVPLFEDIIESFQKAVDDHFEDLIKARPASAPSAWVPNYDVLKPDSGLAWLEIALGLLREARESYNSSRWDELKSRIDQIVQIYPQFADRCIYENILWAVWNVRLSKAKVLLSNWSPSKESPLASMWKAGLLAELDELVEARNILRKALTNIRRALHYQGRNIELLSLEGWCLYLLFAVESSTNIMRRYDLIYEFRERWEQLSAWDCNPWSYKEYFDQILVNMPPRLKPRSEEVRGFDPGHVSTTWRLGGDSIEPFLPGFAAIRLFEQIGIPMRLRMLNIAGDTLLNACRWIEPFVGFWSPALLIRAGKYEIFQKQNILNRSRVAAMPAELASRIHDWCMQILTEEISFSSVDSPLESSTGSLLRVLPEVMSRLAFKLDEDALRQSFQVALQLHKHPFIRSSIHFSDVVQPWLMRILFAANEGLLLEWIPSLIMSPLPDEELQAAVLSRYGWIDPMLFFPLDRDFSNIENLQDVKTNIEKATDWLIIRTASETGEARQRALRRLIRIFHANLMNVEQCERLGNLLWEQVTANNLPDLSGYHMALYLDLPAPEKIDEVSVVKNYLLNLSPQRTVQKSPGGKSILIGGRGQEFIGEVALATKSIIDISGDSGGTIDWTPVEAELLYRKTIEWWQDDKEAFEIEKRSESIGAFGPNPVVETLEYIGLFLAKAILPIVKWTDDDYKKFIDWIAELRQHSISPSIALPYVLLTRPSEAPSIAQIISDDLQSDRRESVGVAAETIRHWICLSLAEFVSPPPETLLQAIVERIVFRQKPGLRECLDQLNLLLFDRIDALNERQIELLIASLGPWYSSTMAANGIRDGEFSDEERCELRVKIAMLAGSLSGWLRHHKPDGIEPSQIIRWRELCATDPLPEVRRAFNWYSRRKRGLLVQDQPNSEDRNSTKSEQDGKTE